MNLWLKLALAIACLSSSPAVEAKPIEYSFIDEDLRESFRIESIHWLESKESLSVNSLENSEVLNDPKFQPLENTTPFLTNTTKSLLYKVKMTNSVEGQRIVIKHPAALAKRIRVFQIEGDQISPVGNHLPDLLSAHMLSPELGTHSYLILINTEVSRLHLEFWEFNNYLRISKWDHFIFGTFFLVAGASMISSLLLGFWFKDKKFYHSSLVILSTLIFFLFQSGLFRWLVSYEVLEKYNARFYGSSIYFVAGCLMNYLNHLINLDYKKNLAASLFSNSLIVISFTFTVLYTFNLAKYNALLAQSIVFLAVLYASSIPFISKMKSKAVVIIAFSWSIFAVHSIIYMAYVNNYIPYTWYSSRSVYLGVLAQNALYIFVLLLMFKNIRMSQILTSHKLTLTEESKAREQESKLAAQSLVHVLCHDLANPLSVIKGNIQILAPTIKEESKKRMNSIKNAADGIESMITIIRKQEAISAGKIELDLSAVSLEEIFTDSFKLFEEKARKKRINLKVESELNGLEVTADKTVLLYSILANILSNAIKFSRVRSDILLRAYVKDFSTVIEIQDFGDGIPEDILENLFDPSKVTSRSGTSGEAGTGFGSLQVKKYTELFGGKVEVESKVGDDSGTTFRLIFPAAQSHAA